MKIKSGIYILCLGALALGLSGAARADHNEAHEMRMRALEKSDRMIVNCLEKHQEALRAAEEAGEEPPGGEIIMDDHDRAVFKDGKVSPFFKCLADGGMLSLDTDGDTGQNGETAEQDGMSPLERLLRGEGVEALMPALEQEENGHHGEHDGHEAHGEQKGHDDAGHDDAGHGETGHHHSHEPAQKPANNSRRPIFLP